MATYLNQAADGFSPDKTIQSVNELIDEVAALPATYAPMRTFDVKLYGATGDGTTDDAYEWQALA